jgi:hypothetical protein
VILSLEISKECRTSFKPILTVIGFLMQEAQRLTDLGLITGVVFSPDRPSVERFARRRFRAVPLGEPHWLYIRTVL